MDAGFQAFWHYGVGGFFGGCPADQDVDAYVGIAEPAPFGPFTQPSELNAVGLTEQAIVGWPDNWHALNAEIYRSVFIHELGHLLSLPEAYDETLVPSLCTGGTSSIMDTLPFVEGSPGTFTFNGHCDTSTPTGHDISRVAAVYSRVFSNPPAPQVIRTAPVTSGALFALLKVPGAIDYSYERIICGGFSPVAQPKQPLFGENPHMVKVDFNLAADRRDVCNQFRVVGGGGSLPINHVGRPVDQLVSVWYSLNGTLTEAALYVDFGTQDVVPTEAGFRNLGGPQFSNHPLHCPVTSPASKFCYRDDIGPAVELQWFDDDDPSIEDIRNRICSGGGLFDSDCDGCADVEELGANVNLGGLRNIHFWWDFYDVPTPALSAADPSGTRNRVVTLADMTAVLYYVAVRQDIPFTPNENGVYWISDYNANGIFDGEEYDRSPNVAISGRPDGAVSLADALAALEQSPDNCMAAP